MGATEEFLAEMQRRRQAQLQKIQGLFQDNPGKGLNMAAAQTRPGLVGGILHSITGLLGGNAAQAGLQSAAGNLAGLFGASAGISGASSALANPALFNSSGALTFL